MKIGRTQILKFTLGALVIGLGLLSLLYQYYFLSSLVRFQPEWDQLLLGAVIVAATIGLNRYRNNLLDRLEPKRNSEKSILYNTQIDPWEAIILGGLLNSLFYLFIFSFDPETYPFMPDLVERLAQRGAIPFLTAGFFAAVVVICILKAIKASQINQQFNLMNDTIASGTDPEGDLSAVSDSFLTKRMELKKEGEKSSEFLEYFAELDREELSNSYTFSRFLLWAIPVLGFIGTVWGISLSINGFTLALGQAGVDGLSSSSLGGSLRYLSVAFDTTLVALTFGVIAMLISSFTQRYEENLLTKCHILLTKDFSLPDLVMPATSTQPYVQE